MSAEYNTIIIIIDAYTKMTHFKLVILKNPIKKKRINIINAIKIIYCYIFRQHNIPKSIINNKNT